MGRYTVKNCRKEMSDGTWGLSGMSDLLTHGSRLQYDKSLVLQSRTHLVVHTLVLETHRAGEDEVQLVCTVYSFRYPLYTIYIYICIYNYIYFDASIPHLPTSRIALLPPSASLGSFSTPARHSHPSLPPPHFRTSSLYSSPLRRSRLPSAPSF
jgi:hypothetical protein